MEENYEVIATQEGMLSRRKFVGYTSLALTSLALHIPFVTFSKSIIMEEKTKFDAIIVGGSYSGLAAAMAMGRALKNILVIDSGKPCNIQTPFSHNFLTQDGNTPAGIAKLGRKQVEEYRTVKFITGLAVSGKKLGGRFELRLHDGRLFEATVFLFATGIKDIMPTIEGFRECWGISVIHCPYCHGYEVRDTQTGILGNGEQGFDFARLINNWTRDLTLYTNGPADFTPEQLSLLNNLNIDISEKQIKQLEHKEGKISHVVFTDGTKSSLNALYAPRPFE